MATPRRMAIKAQKQTSEILERVETFEAEIKALIKKVDGLIKVVEVMAEQMNKGEAEGPPKKARAAKK